MKGIKTFQELKPNSLVKELVLKIEQELPKFPGSNEFLHVLEPKKNENQHSLAFCLFMSNSSKFSFQRENPQKANSTVDMGVYFGSNLIFTIEAKILPIPKGTKNKPRFDYEYVYGKGAGIQRFKDEKHGLNNEDELLEENGMIAYVKEKDFQYWHSCINEWILDANWQESEKLTASYLSSTAKLISEHNRINGKRLLLHHFWVYVSY